VTVCCLVANTVELDSAKTRINVVTLDILEDTILSEGGNLTVMWSCCVSCDVNKCQEKARPKSSSL